MQTSNLHPNVRILRMHAMIRELGFVIPVVIAFIEWRGVSFSQFMAIQAMYTIVMLLADPILSPLADKFGRKRAVIVGSALWILGHVFMAFGYGWETYALGEIILGLGIAAYRPATEALLFDSLASVNRQGAHHTAYARQHRAQSYAGSAAMLAGGVMFLWHPMAPIVAELAVTALLPLLALRLTEAPYAAPIRKPTYAEIWRSAWATLARRDTRWLVILPGLISGSTITLFWAVQPVFTGQGLNASWFGVLLAGYFALRGWFAGLCPWLARRFGEFQAFGVSVVAMAGAFAGLALLPWWAAYPLFVVGSGFTYMMTETLGKDLVHRHVESAFRSTAMGGYQLAGRIIGISTLGSCSLLQPLLGMPVTLLLIGTATASLAMVSLYRLHAATR